MKANLFICSLVSLLLSMNQQMIYATNDDNNATIYLKTPGNQATKHPLVFEEIGDGLQYAAPKSGNIPVRITYQNEEVNGHIRMKVLLTATEDIYFHLEQEIQTPFQHDDCQFYMPGFWYRRNLRSPQEAPSFHTSDSWLIREDRLSAPLTGIYNEKTGDYYTVARIDDFSHEALTTHKEGEIILSGRSSIGYTGFLNNEGKATLAFGFPFHEAPKTYIRKLMLSPKVMAFHHLPKNESMELAWEVVKDNGKDFSSFIGQVWNYSYDLYRPQPVTTPYTPQIMKETMTQFVTDSYVDTQELPYLSGVHLHTEDCISSGIAEIGFVGRVLLNSFNALEYGEQQGRNELVDITQNIFSGYLQHGFNAGGFFREVVNYDNKTEERNLSIRRQSEGLYAVLYYLQYEKSKGRKHPEWEQKVKQLLDMILTLQNEDGSFPRKFKEDLTIVDATGGSTPSATPMLVLSSIYFKDKRYLESAKRTANYLEKEIISKADYFSSTLDANCEDKEASYYATTALYHLALISKGVEKQHYSDLAKQAAYFCLSWYYLWDVPFAQGQMLGDVGLKTRGWGNVSVENNHIDVYIFDFATILQWLAESYDEPRFADFAQVIQTSMCQLLPHDKHLCGIGKTGYYPEVVQHTNWDYGKNGKGFYNDIFAPGWTVASLWEMLTPERIRLFVK